MDDLTKKECEACQAGAPVVAPEEIAKYMVQIPQWELLAVDGVNRLQRVFKFRNFAEALSFTNRVGEIAEEVGHHPAILTEWGKVTVTWWSHKIGGLHLNDFIMASRTDNLM